MVYQKAFRFLSDQGRNFESSLINEFHKLTGVKKLRTTPYRPQTNGQCEKFNYTLINMIRNPTCGTETKFARPCKYTGPCFQLYGVLQQQSTVPYYIIFGREQNLPIDIEFGVRTPDLIAASTQNYVEQLDRRDWLGHLRILNKSMNKKRKGTTETIDKKVRCSKLDIGDRVLVRQNAFKGKHKVQDKWEDNTYVVVDQPAKNTPVFTVQKEEGGRL